MRLSAFHRRPFYYLLRHDDKLRQTHDQVMVKILLKSVRDLEFPERIVGITARRVVFLPVLQPPHRH